MAFTPFGTVADLRSYVDLTITVFEIVDGGRSGLFYYDSTDTTSADDGNMIVIQGASRRFKRPFHGFVYFEWFGVTPTTTYIDESVDMMKAVNFLISKSGGILKLREKIYAGNLKWKGNDNISIEGLSPLRSMLWSPVENKFAVEVDTEFQGIGVYYRDLTFSGMGTINRLRHGLYLNIAANIIFDNVQFKDCGIGLMCNSTIDGRFGECRFENNYLGAFFTTVSGADATITDIDGQTITVSNAYFVSQPCEHVFTACTFNNNAIHMVIDDPSNTYDASINMKFYGGLMQASSVGVYCKSSPPLIDTPMIVDGMWIENFIGEHSVPRLFNGDTLPVCDFYFNGGSANIRGGLIHKIYANFNSVVDLDSCTFYHSMDSLVSTGGGSFTGRNIKAFAAFLPYYFENGVNSFDNYMIGFYSNAKTTRSMSFLENKVWSNTCDFDAPMLGAFGSTVTRVDGGVMGRRCINVLAAHNYGVTSPVIPVVQGKIYVAAFNVRSVTGTFNLLLASTAGGSNKFANQQFLVTPEWKQIVLIGRGMSTGATADSYIGNYSGSTQEFQISGWQILEFDLFDELYAFLKTSDFVVDSLDNLMIENNSSSSAPNKSGLNSLYGYRNNGFKVNYKSITGGARSYQKETNSTTSEWIETIWSTGVSSIVL